MIRTLTYRRIKNIGNFENEQLEVSVDVTGKDADIEYKKLKRFVEKKLKIKKGRKIGPHGPVCVCDECM